MGTYSGFESTTSLYYNMIDVAFSTGTSINKIDLNRHPSVFISPNHINGNFKVNSGYEI